MEVYGLTRPWTADASLVPGGSSTTVSLKDDGPTGLTKGQA